MSDQLKVQHKGLSNFQWFTLLHTMLSDMSVLVSVFNQTDPWWQRLENGQKCYLKDSLKAQSKLQLTEWEFINVNRAHNQAT